METTKTRVQMNFSKNFELLPSFVNSQMKKNIIYVGSNNVSGYTNAGFGYIQNLLDNGNTVKFIPYLDDNESNEYEEIEKCIDIEISSPDLSIIHSIPELWDSLIKKHKIKSNKIIGRTVWEFEKVPEKWIKSINNSKVDIVSVPSSWNKEIFLKCGIKKSIILEPHIPLNRKYNLISFSDIIKKGIIYGNSNIDFNSYFKFYSISQFIRRKGIDDAIYAFCNAFKKEDNVVFLISTFLQNHGEKDQNEIDEYLQSILKKYKKQHPTVIYLKNKLTYDEIKSLHYHSNCYFSMTKSEGVGLPFLDAYQINKPILTTGYGGHVEYIKNNVDYIPYELNPVNSEIYRGCYLDNTYFWAQPNIEYAKEKLKYIVKHGSFLRNSISIETDNNLSILYIGQYGTSGYATAAKQYIANYVLNNIPISWEPLYFDSSELDNENYINILAKSTINKNIKYNTVIMHCTPDLWPEMLKTDKYKGKRKIGYTVWETDVLKPEWVSCINMMDEVWCPSTYNQKVFLKSGVIIPIKVIPHLFFKSKLPEKKYINIDGANKKYYTFYNISELNERKNIKDVLISFCEEFTNKQHVQLILKIHYKDYSTKNIEYCKNYIYNIINGYKNRPNIIPVYNNLNETEILALHSYGDCYVSLARSEGFGLTIFEAYKYGNDVIATGYGGHLDFLGDGHNGLVDYTLIDVKNMETFNSNYNHTNQKWAQPSIHHAKKIMRNMYNSQ